MDGRYTTMAIWNRTLGVVMMMSRTRTTAGFSAGLRQCQNCPPFHRQFSNTVSLLEQQRQQQPREDTEPLSSPSVPPSPSLSAIPRPQFTPTTSTQFRQTAAQKPNRPSTGDPDEENFVPRPLGQPIGLAKSPLETLKDEFAKGKKGRKFLDYDRNLARRKELTQELSRSYFRDFSNLRFHKGKTFLANPLIFKSSAALYFPNFSGTTLKNPSDTQDTAPRMVGKISIVSMVANQWAKSQVDSFIGKAENPTLHALLEKNEDVCQTVEINIEPGMLKSILQRMFLYRLRRERKVEDHANYFFIRKPTPGAVKESIGLMNEKVGYVYLVDQEGKIRWAGSAIAEGEERDYLVKGLERLIRNARPADGRESGESGAEVI